MRVALQLIMALSVLLALESTPSPAGGPRKAAIFDFELVDTSLEGEKRGLDPAETARLKMISALLREKLAASDRYEVVSTAPAAKEIEEQGDLRGCNGCAARIARELGADVAVTGQIHKVSTLVLNIRIQIRDAKTGRMLKNYNADIRGNTDESWAHGVRWLVRNRLSTDW